MHADALRFFAGLSAPSGSDESVCIFQDSPILVAQVWCAAWAADPGSGPRGLRPCMQIRHSSGAGVVGRLAFGRQLLGSEAHLAKRQD